MGKRSSHKNRSSRFQNDVQAAITTLSQSGWEVALQDGEVEDQDNPDENIQVVRAIIVSPWQPKELIDDPDRSVIGGRDL